MNECVRGICPETKDSLRACEKCYHRDDYCFEQYCENDVEITLQKLSLVLDKDDKRKIYCKCIATRDFEGWVTERKPQNDLSRFEPCRYRCKETIKTGKCYLKIMKRMKKENERNLDWYFRRTRWMSHLFKTRS